MITNSYDFEPNYGRDHGIYMPTPESQRYFSKLERERREWGLVAVACILAGVLIAAYAVVIPTADAIHDAFRPMPHNMLCFDKHGTLIPRGNEDRADWKECRTVTPAE